VPDTTTQQPILVTVPEAARLLGIRTWRAYALINAGVIPSVRLGERCLRVPVDALRQRMNEMAEGGAEGRSA